MPKEMFRKVALERLSSPEQLDQLIRITTPAGWISLLAIGGLLICALAWGIWGSIPTRVEGQGILMSRGGNYAINAPNAGRLKNLYFSLGDRVQPGQIVAVIDQPEIEDKIATARQKLNELNLQYNQTIQFYSEDLSLEKDLRRQEQASYELTNQALRQELSLLEQRLADQKRLRKLGLITTQDILNTQEQINNAKREIRKNENNLKGLKVKKLQLDNQKQQKLVDLRNQIDNTQEQLQDLENNLNKDSIVASPFEGKVVGIDVDLGDIVDSGTPIVTLELTGKHARFLEAVLFVDSAQGKKAHQGMKAQVSPGTAKKDMYGSIVGLVSFVSAFPASAKEMNRLLQNQDLVETLSREGPPIEIRVALVPDPRTPSRYKWTSSRGPAFRIVAGTLCSGSITVRRQPPITLLIPLAKKYILGE